MKTKQVIEADTANSAKPYRVTDGKKFRLKDVDPGRHAGISNPTDKPRAKEALAERRRGARGIAGHALRAGSLVGAAHLPGDGCGGKGRDDQARDVGRESAGLPGVVVQGADEHGPRSRLSLALRQGTAGARAHRHFQSQLLRGDARRARASGVSRGAEAAARNA